ncbi:MAG: hypothetical protein D6766_05275 [Verrucomicrobia bacterium]|nr:MAG: hypothetical protein D6766_05275 [Verrucomicrobiota bacterium]
MLRRRRWLPLAQRQPTEPPFQRLSGALNAFRCRSKERSLKSNMHQRQEGNMASSMRGSRSARISRVILIAACLGMAAVQAKETISGHIYNAATGFGMVGIDLDVFDPAGKPVKVTGAKSGVGGAYTITLPGPGTYRVRADASLTSGFADQFYDHQFLKSAATPITVNPGANVTGIDFHLSPGWEIRGRVTAGGAPLGNVDLDLFDAATGEFLSGYPGVTAPDGTFAVGALPAGAYILRVQPDPALGQFYVESWYNGGTNLASATPIPVSSAHVSGINFDLAPGGSISGTVTDRLTGRILPGLDLDVFDATGVRLPYNAITDTNGQYYMGPMPAGQYYLRVDPKPDAGYERQYYPGANLLANAALITVTVGRNVPNIDFALARAGHIQGTMRDAASGAPLAGVDLDVFDSTGIRLDISATSQADGTYDLGPLPAGDYIVRADPALALNHARVYYPGTFFRADAVPVTVTANQATTGIDFDLPAAGAIAGTMVAAGTGAPVAGVDLDVWRAADTNRLDVTATTAPDGSYVLGPLPAGEYFVRADPAPTSGWAVEYHPDRPGIEGAVPVVVVAGQTNAPVNFELDPAGWITGMIADAGGQPLPGIDLDVYDAVTDLRLPFSAVTDSNGFYVIGPLRPGSYKVRADPNPLLGYALEYFDAQTTRPAATPVEVVAGAARSGVDFTLERAAVLSGRIVSADTGQPIPNMDLDLLQAADGVRLDQTVLTDASGAFTITDVPAGQYILRGDPDMATQPYVRTYYGQTTDPAAATVISVAAGENRTGLEIALFSQVPPTVAITSPADQTAVVVPATVELVAETSSPIGAIAQVDFYEGNQWLASDSTAPYTAPVDFTGPGSRTFKAVATDIFGLTSTSAPITLHGVENQAPVVALSSPADGTSYVAPAEVTLTATASDPDGSVAKVELFNGATRLASLTAAPYTFTWANVPAGDYTLTAVATDDRGLTATSTPVTVHVQAGGPPTPVALTIGLDASGRVEISFGSETNRTYYLEAADGLGAAAWVVVAQATGDGGPIRLTDTPPPAGVRFYRVRVE